MKKTPLAKSNPEDFITLTPAPRLSLQQAMQLAEQHQANGRLQQAEMLLKQILQVNGEHAHALHLLGVIAHQVGKTEQAVELLGKALESLPEADLFHSNLGEMYRQLKKFDQALLHGEKAVALNPQSATAHSNLGIAYYDCKQWEKAENCQQKALVLNSNLVSALNNMGSLLRERKDKEGAISYYRKALAAAPAHLESINNLGAVLNESDRPEEAIQVLLSAIKINPNYAEAHCNIGSAFLGLEEFDKAMIGFKRAIALKPDHDEAFQGLAKLHQEQKNLAEAEAAANQALKLAPEKASVLSLLGGIYLESGHADKAELIYEKALALDPDHIGSHLGKGQLLMEQGKMQEAEARFLNALQLDPKNTGAYLSLAQVKKTKVDDDHFKFLISEASSIAQMPDTKALSLHFALGKCYEDTKQYGLAFPHFMEGCRLKRKRIQYSADDNDLAVENIRKFFTRETIDRLRSPACASELPIFVLGMPRSGTTLTEQIIASHPLVHGAGELNDLLELSNSPNGKVIEGYPLSLQGITRDILQKMGERYITGLKTRNPEAARITDKMPANFNCLGLIHLMLPNAKIVHVKRNPVDTCLSCFTRLFNKSQHQSYDLAEIGRYYRNYAMLMEHWRSVLPAGAFYEVQYEALVSDNENQARALIDYCELPWNDACLESHKTERNIRTASVTQVRQPIYQTSIERWRKYESYLAPLLEALGDLVPAKP